MYPISRHSPRLHLRELHPGDAEGLFAIYGDARATEHMSMQRAGLIEEGRIREHVRRGGR
ncbi:hypothetical protein OG333_36750 [Streptomyces anulatus]|uniref:hypothetical protein n=1 Tax=Streptomyces anulatus TaxID=1892 RepID=UPI0038697792|nr:hypothetical protein OG333_36750 [Streptomyces anulatus]